MGLLPQSILSACIVSFLMKSVQPHNDGSDKAVIGGVKDERKIENHLQDLFDSLVWQDTKKDETYRTLLEQEVTRDRQTFDSVKEEFQFARNENVFRRGTAGGNIVVKKREAVNGTKWSRYRSKGPAEDLSLDFDLKSLDYKGTWTDFCDNTKIEKDFAEFNDHDVKRLRILICQFKAQKRINRRSLPTFSTYKYCQMIRATTDRAYKLLRKKFTEHFLNRVGEIPESTPPTEECFTKCMDAFHKKCMGKLNPCVRMFQSLISSICVKPGISAKHISRYMAEVCAGDYVTDQIDWMPIDLSLVYYVVE